MTLIAPLFSETAGWTVTIDGRVYRPALIDSSGRLIVVGPTASGAVEVEWTDFIPTSVANNHVSVTTAGIRVQLPNVACKAVSIAARPDNTNNIYLGGSGVTSSNGRVLAPGDAIDIAIDNVNRLYIDSAEDGEGISYLAVN